MIYDLSYPDVQMARRMAIDICEGYARGAKEESRVLAIQGKPRIDNDVQTQAAGRMAEIAACRYLGIDPIFALNWSSRCDTGADFVLSDTRRVDVKSSLHPRAQYLIWPVTKKHFMQDMADVMIFARVLDASIGRVELVGWTNKDYFLAHHETANGLSGMIDGTPFVRAANLWDMGKLQDGEWDGKQRARY